MNEKQYYFKPNKKKNTKRYPSRWWSYWTQPCGKLHKRSANKKVRRTSDVTDGKSYKKLWGWFEWC